MTPYVAAILKHIEDKSASCRKRDMSDAANVLSGLADDIRKEFFDPAQLPMAPFLKNFIERISAANFAAGWWSQGGLDLRDDPVLSNFVIGTKLMLVVTEVSEAMEGHRKDLMDDHLPHRPMVEVEIADAVIRLFDLAGNYRRKDGSRLDVAGALVEKMAYNAQRADHKLEARMGAGGKSV